MPLLQAFQNYSGNVTGQSFHFCCTGNHAILSPITKVGIVFGVPIEFEIVNKARRDCFLKLEVPHSQGSFDLTFKLH